MGNAYKNGKGVPQSGPEALKWCGSQIPRRRMSYPLALANTYTFIAQKCLHNTRTMRARVVCVCVCMCVFVLLHMC